jgi:hypothetical protein
MNAKEKVRWFNARDPLNKWSVGKDVYCLQCDAIFKAQDVIEDIEGDPNCPLCLQSSPVNFFKEPWWRPDLIEQSATKYRMTNTWIVKPIRATAGKPTWLPPRNP